MDDFGHSTGGAALGIAVTRKLKIVCEQVPEVQPLFAPYVVFPFAKLGRVRYLPGVERILCEVGGSPAMISQADIAFMQDEKAAPSVRTGAVVKIIGTPFAGMTGRVLGARNGRVMVALLGHNAVMFAPSELQEITN